MIVNAVFEGGGVKGISLAGAVKAAEQAGVVFNRVAGTSSGSIVAALLAAGFSADEMSEIVKTTPFESFLHRAPIFNTKVIGPAARLFLKKGLYSGEALEVWIHHILAAKGVKTFADIPQGKLMIIASDITNGRILVLPEDLGKLGANPSRFAVSKAIRMSTSIPYFFDPVMLRMTGEAARGKSFVDQFVYIVDGGLLSNFPLWLFDDASEGAGQKPVPTIGFQMVGRTTNKPHLIRGPISMLQAMFETMLSAHDERYIEQENRFRTIKIPTLGVGTTQFHITPEESQQLYESGMQAGKKFFAGWKP
ncbi:MULTISPECIES: patatin-like phospholipase family protein [Paenibacillus]|uniref:patatin-like phospholipase family protein n=1 Tax=Paenibacillus TaxID=44249 RepID=UPI000E22CB44|nr:MULTISPECIES: patatin-like phospholipase family protein [Paenibacillus]MCM2999457.1 patatin-like phospholipase family protein [Paenibacillus cellulositrophicus]RED39347.1 NTE family protein [Paenibacillus sp. VMFN-D1]